MRTIVDQLSEVYYKYEWWHKNRLNKIELDKYHIKLLDNNNIIYYEENGELLGYVEFWRINFEQFGRLICQCPFSAYLEDVQSGKIAYVANVWIKENVRHTHVARVLKLMFFNANENCEFFVGEARRKKSEPVKVFTRSALWGKRNRPQ